MAWLVEQAKSQELFRKRVPQIADDQQEQDKYLQAIRASWNELLDAEEILQKFMNYVDGTAGSRPIFALPDVLANNIVLSRKNSSIVLLAPRATITPDERGGFILTALGRRWKFPTLAKSIISMILSPGHITVDQVIEANKNITEERTAEVVFTLLQAGVIAL